MWCESITEWPGGLFPFSACTGEVRAAAAAEFPWCPASHLPQMGSISPPLPPPSGANEWMEPPEIGPQGPPHPPSLDQPITDSTVGGGQKVERIWMKAEGKAG